MYSLKQAALLVYGNQQQCLKLHSYSPFIGTQELWEHKTRQTKFLLCIDGFGIKCYNKNDAYHLLTCLAKYYNYTTDWKGKNYCSFTIDWH